MLKACEAQLQRREHVEKRLQRRSEYINAHIKMKRDLEFSPNPNLHKREHALSARAVDCVLAPEVTVGPYYVSSQLVRDDIREDQPGVPLLLDVQVIDVTTCQVIPKVIMDFWHCNTTGKYSGFSAEGTAGLTFNRGLAQSDEDGIIQITSNFPGWYQGRATHIHIAAHQGATVSSSKITGGTVSHIGQIFFPESTLEEIDTADVYKTNRVTRLKNANDGIFSQQNSGYNALSTVVKLGSKLSDGLVASITVGLNPSKDYTSQLNGGAGGAPGGGPPPSGGFPGAPSSTSTSSTTTSSTTTSSTSSVPTSGTVSRYGQCGGTFAFFCCASVALLTAL
ncbi:aromatic compound dioxygenase [Ascobolus immersus RN42]|uniref:Aromatic compound dioxygenase n=1 Tax=Ascobolus immersus RN42 TaxID=1160509 RepID=A0A3N4HZH2_ASCIM|nr:aromatic compound dioxygenase [Ascobolus immersus RN42]